MNATKALVLTNKSEVCAIASSPSVISKSDAIATANLLKAVADPVRIRLISMLVDSPEGELCVCNLVEPLELSQPTVSHHLKILAEAGLVSREKRGTWAWYSLDRERFAQLSKVFN